MEFYGVWNDKNLKVENLKLKIRDELVKQQLVNAKEIHDLEPNLKPLFIMGCVFYDYAKHARNPKILIKLFENLKKENF